MEQIQDKNDNLDSNLPKAEDPKGNNPLSTVVVLSLVFGLLGAVVGNTYITPLLRKSSAFGVISGGNVKTVQVQEQSAVIDVVTQASPAVVSIIISKDLNNGSAQSLGFPFNLDPFFQSRGSQDNTPNIQQVGG